MSRQLKGKALLMVMHVHNPRGFPIDINVDVFPPKAAPTRYSQAYQVNLFYRNRFNSMSLSKKNELRRVMCMVVPRNNKPPITRNTIDHLSKGINFSSVITSHT